MSSASFTYNSTALTSIFDTTTLSDCSGYTYTSGGITYKPQFKTMDSSNTLIINHSNSYYSYKGTNFASLYLPKYIQYTSGTNISVTIPDWCTKVDSILIGGGGGGGNNQGESGGGGGCVRLRFFVRVSKTITITVGAGGGGSGGNVGGNGGDTTLTYNTYTCKGLFGSGGGNGVNNRGGVGGNASSTFPASEYVEGCFGGYSGETGYNSNERGGYNGMINNSIIHESIQISSYGNGGNGLGGNGISGYIRLYFLIN